MAAIPSSRRRIASTYPGGWSRTTGESWPGGRTGCAGICTSWTGACRFPRGRRWYRVIDELVGQLDDTDGVVARLARQFLVPFRDLITEISLLGAQLGAQLGALVRKLAHSLLALLGCGVLGAAVIVGETAGEHWSCSKTRLCPVRRHGADRSLVRRLPGRSGSTAAATAQSTLPCT